MPRRILVEDSEDEGESVGQASPQYDAVIFQDRETGELFVGDPGFQEEDIDNDSEELEDGEEEEAEEEDDYE